MRKFFRLQGSIFAIILTFLPLQSQAVSLSIDCGEWVDRTDGRKIQYEAYVIGLLNGMRNVWGATYFVREKKWEKEPLEKLGSAKQIFLYVDKYCRDKPLSDVLTATYDLWTDVAQRR